RKKRSLGGVFHSRWVEKRFPTPNRRRRGIENPFPAPAVHRRQTFPQFHGAEPHRTRIESTRRRSAFHRCLPLKLSEKAKRLLFPRRVRARQRRVRLPGALLEGRDRQFAEH